MYKELIDEYNKQLVLNHIDKDQINKFNLDIIASKENSLYKMLDNIYNDVNTVDLSELKKLIKDKNVLNLIYYYLNENNINSYSPLDSEGTSITYATNDKKYCVLTKEEEIELFKRIEQGDKSAVNEIVNHNIKLVKSVAGKYPNNYYTNDDLISIGILGLYKAIHKFDYNKGYKFSTYAIPWINQTIRIELYKNNYDLKVSFDFQRQQKLYTQTINNLKTSLKRNPTDEEISKESGLKLEQIENIRKFIIRSNCVSLDQPVNEEDDSTLGELIEDSTQDNIDILIEKKLNYELLNSIIDTLDEKEQDIIRMRFGFGNYKIPRTLDEIGKKYNLTRERIRQIEEKLIRKISYKYKRAIKENKPKTLVRKK